MFKLIKDGNFVFDEWKTLTLAEGESPEFVRLPVGPLLVPLSVWKARRTELIHREYEHSWQLGVWLSAEEDVNEIAGDIDDFSVIAVVFDKFKDGSSYTIAKSLRERYGYSGELRAIGDIPGDRIAYQHQVGFNAFAVRASRKISAVISGFDSVADRQHNDKLVIA